MMTGYVMIAMWVWGYAFDVYWWQAKGDLSSREMVVVKSFVLGLLWPVALGHEVWTRWQDRKR